MENNKSRKMIAPIVFGSIIGATLGVLFAPDKGKATREKIKTKTLDTAHTLSEEIGHAKEEITKFVHEKRTEFDKKMETRLSNLSYKAENILDKMEEKIENLKRKNATLHK